MDARVGEQKSTKARFEPEIRRGLSRPNAVEWMLMVTGVSICGIGSWAIVVGVAIALTAFYFGFFAEPKVKRGLYFGNCPHCGAPMSATHYQVELGCPSCDRTVRVRDGRYEAV